MIALLQPLNSNISSSDGFFILFYSISFYNFNSKFITFELGSLRLLSVTHLQLILFTISTQYTVYNSYTVICLHPKFYLYCGIFSYLFSSSNSHSRCYLYLSHWITPFWWSYHPIFTSMTTEWRSNLVKSVDGQYC